MVDLLGCGGVGGSAVRACDGQGVRRFATARQPGSRRFLAEFGGFPGNPRFRQWTQGCLAVQTPTIRYGSSSKPVLNGDASGCQTGKALDQGGEGRPLRLRKYDRIGDNDQRQQLNDEGSKRLVVAQLVASEAGVVEGFW